MRLWIERQGLAALAIVGLGVAQLWTGIDRTARPVSAGAVPLASTAHAVGDAAGSRDTP